MGSATQNVRQRRASSSYRRIQVCPNKAYKKGKFCFPCLKTVTFRQRHILTLISKPCSTFGCRVRLIGVFPGGVRLFRPSSGFELRPHARSPSTTPSLTGKSVVFVQGNLREIFLNTSSVRSKISLRFRSSRKFSLKDRLKNPGSKS